MTQSAYHILIVEGFASTLQTTQLNVCSGIPIANSTEKNGNTLQRASPIRETMLATYLCQAHTAFLQSMEILLDLAELLAQYILLTLTMREPWAQTPLK